MIKLTVFTPTYNRIELLKRCYKSMKRQTCGDFIWMIIDDGSDDGTNDTVKEWIKENNSFELQYYYKENGGLHTAYNTAIEHISTELCVCIDSDDYMPDDAVEQIISFWNKYGSDEYAGIVGLDYDIRGNRIGDPLPDLKSVNLIDLLTGRYHLINGDRTNVVRTELYKRYAPMKSFPGEKFFNPHYMHLQISRDYDFLVFNHNLRFVDYQQNGMTNSILAQYANSPNSFGEIRKLYLSFPHTPFKFRFRNCIHLVSSYQLAGKGSEVLKDTPFILMTIAAFPFGTLLTQYIKHNTCL